MAAFRKLFLALAVVTMFTAAVSAQSVPALQCTANAGVPPTIRSEGLTELVGDVTLNCTGGIPTQLNAPVPQSNVTVFLNTNITSRILSTSQGTWTEAILMIDEPHSTSNPTVPLFSCGDANSNEQTNVNPGVCTVFGTGNGVAVYNGQPATNTQNARPNVWQSRQYAANAVTWSGIPIDAPGTSGTRVIRITNVRANANQLGVSSTLVPTQITMYISVTGSNQLPINNPTQTVAFIQPGLVSAVFNAANYLQCQSNNQNVATGASYGGAIADFVVRLREGFQSAFKRKNWNSNGILGTTYPSGGDQNQNVPGAVYNTESAFENIGPGADPVPNPPTQLVNVGSAVSPTATFPSTRNLVGAGVANSGTRLMLNFGGVPNGASIWVPVVVRVQSQLSGAITGTAVLTSTDGNGAGGFSPVGSVSGSATVAGCSGNPGLTCFGTASGSQVAPTGGLAQVSVFNGSGIAVYEVLYSDPFNPEQVFVPVVVAYVSNPGNNLPAPGVQSTVNASFAPLSTVGTADSGSPIPRFAPGTSPRNLFLINKCNCNLLFPFVTNQIGYDTGIAISNTSLDSGTGFGTTPQQGIVTLNYYCGQPGCTSPPQATTNAPVPAGQQLTFSLFGGGGYGIAATPGFQGYIIAQAQFQFCHAYAFISAQGEDPAAGRTGANTGYLALVMDPPGIYRPATVGENLAH